MMWQMLTYGFIHFEFWHWIGNTLCLWMFGSAIESAWGSQRFLKLFYIGVICRRCRTTLVAANTHVLGSPI